MAYTRTEENVIKTEKLSPGKGSECNKGHPVLTAVHICLQSSLHIKSFSIHLLRPTNKNPPR